jgi:uncharacterized protein (TIGR03083 family)
MTPHISPTDPGAAYRGVRLGVIELLRTTDDDALDRIAPATPEWRVRDLAGHLAGVCDDVVHGNMEGAPGPAWTGAQVDKRREWELEQLVSEWTEHAETIEPQMRDWGSSIGQMVFDAWTHEQDIRGALGTPGGRDTAATEVAFDWMVGNLRAPDDVDPADPRLRPGIELRTEVGTVTIFGAPPNVHLGGPEAVLEVSRFEFLRTITGRRSRDQIAALAWSGDPLVDRLVLGDPFHPAALDIVE